MASLIINVLLKPLQYLIHKDFNGYFQRMSLIDKLIFLVSVGTGYRFSWGLTYLLLRRYLHQEYNLFNVENKSFKTIDKELNDPRNGVIGGSGSFFGRNILPVDQTNKIVHFVDNIGFGWHRLPVFLGLTYLLLRRHLHQEYNLFNVGNKSFKTTDKEPNDPRNGVIGGSGSFFGRNILPVDQTNKVMKPDPMVVATKLLARRNFIDTGKQFNMIAASWIQFMVHDWVDHLENTHQLVEMRAPDEVASQCPLKSFRFYKTKEFETNNSDNGIKTGYLNIRTAWWDGSVIYGNNKERSQKVRSFKDGKLKICSDGLLPVNSDHGTILSGDVRNIWAGLAALQALFVQEHNAVCDALKKEYPDLGDEELYGHARLVTSAVIAKIHTIDWTVELLKTDTMLAAMRGNWYGLLGKKLKDRFGHVGISLLSGIVGSKKTVDHGVPYSLTEEFVTVYRMHPLLQDKLILRNIDAPPTAPNKSPPFSNQMGMEEMIGGQGVENLSRIGLARLMVSMGHQASGALELWNYPMWLRNLISQNVDGTDRPDPVDMAALEVYRDRERGVARYNDFRRGLLLKPISKWADLSDDKQVIEALGEVYGDDVEELDILVGLLAETKIKGFAISQTAFFIFLVMATRLEADRNFTSEFKEERYRKKGLEWINNTESLKDVLDRHYPEMSSKWMNSNSAFTVWDSSPQPHNPIPLYLRLPK